MIDLARTLFTVVCFGAFIAFVLIADRKGAKAEYDQIARGIVDDDDTPIANTSSQKQSDSHENGANK